MPPGFEPRCSRVCRETAMFLPSQCGQAILTIIKSVGGLQYACEKDLRNPDHIPRVPQVNHPKLRPYTWMLGNTCSQRTGLRIISAYSVYTVTTHNIN